MRLPKHIGIIPDGNRRWAVKNGLNKENGYDFGLLPGLELLKEAQKIGIKEITYYGFTVDNCKRPKEQFDSFKNACVKACGMIANESVSLLVIGNSDSKCFPQELSVYRERKDLNGGGIKVNFLVNYGWDWDLKSYESGLKSKDISRIDLIIRWGGMRRLSGFLPVQSVYSDFYVIDDLWPDYNSRHIYDALNWYDKQDVTLGG